MDFHEVPQAQGPCAARDGLAESMERAREAWEGRWEAERAPTEEFMVAFAGGWDACGRAMEAMASFDGVEVRRWCHDPPRHEVYFACSFDALQAVKLALRSTGAGDFRCCRAHRPAETEGGGAHGT